MYGDEPLRACERTWDCDGLLTLGNLQGSADEGRLVVGNGAVVEGYDDVTVLPNGTIHMDGGTLRAPYVEVLAPPCGADLDGSGRVGLDDLATLLGTWGTCPL